VQLKTVVTARVFLEKVKIQPPAKRIFIEDIARTRASVNVSRALAASLCRQKPSRNCWLRSPACWIDVATIIFSSGSTGDPKGVILTHYNIVSNVEQLNQVFMLHADDRIMGILPFFHSFGFTVAVFARSHGHRRGLSPESVDSRVSALLSNKYAVTMLLATRRSERYSAAAPRKIRKLALRYGGAENCRPHSQAFEDHFGIARKKVTLQPSVRCGREHHRFSRGVVRQVGAKRGSMATLAGISVKIVDPDTLQLWEWMSGLLLVRGRTSCAAPQQAEKTAEVLRDAGQHGECEIG